jgi:hypothetical protein
MNSSSMSDLALPEANSTNHSESYSNSDSLEAVDENDLTTIVSSSDQSGDLLRSSLGWSSHTSFSFPSHLLCAYFPLFRSAGGSSERQKAQIERTESSLQGVPMPLHWIGSLVGWKIRWHLSARVNPENPFNELQHRTLIPRTGEFASLFTCLDEGILLISALVHDSPAQRAGLLVHDIITKFGELTVEEWTDESSIKEIKRIGKEWKEQNAKMPIHVIRQVKDKETNEHRKTEENSSEKYEFVVNPPILQPSQRSDQRRLSSHSSHELYCFQRLELFIDWNDTRTNGGKSGREAELGAVFTHYPCPIAISTLREIDQIIGNQII